MVKYRITREVIDSRRKKMTTTSYARFDAHKRCERLNNSSLFALTSTSLLLIYIGILNVSAQLSSPLSYNRSLAAHSMALGR